MTDTVHNIDLVTIIVTTVMTDTSTSSTTTTATKTSRKIRTPEALIQQTTDSIDLKADANMHRRTIKSQQRRIRELQTTNLVLCQNYICTAELTRAKLIMDAQQQRLTELMKQLEEANKRALIQLPKPNVNVSLRRFVLTYIEGEARDFFVELYDMLIAAIEENSTRRNHTLECREWVDRCNIERFNATQTSGQLQFRDDRLSYHRRLNCDIQKRFKVEFDKVLEIYRTETQVTHVRVINDFAIGLARAYFEREFLLRPIRNMIYLDDREASHRCHYGMCLNFTHLVFELHCINIDRNSCRGPGYCSHSPPCLAHGCHV